MPGLKIPKGALLPEDYGLPRDLLAEEYLDALPKAPLSPKAKGTGQSNDKGKANAKAGQQDNAKEKAEQNNTACDDKAGVQSIPEPNNHGSGASGQPAPWELPQDMDEAEAEALAKAAAKAIADAKAKHPGSVPGTLARYAEELLKPKSIPWHKILASVLTNALTSAGAKVDLTWNKPSRKGIALGYPLPRWTGRTPKIGVAIDTSGSIPDEDLKLGLGVVHGLMQAAGTPNLYLVVFDAQVQFAGWVNGITAVKSALKGGGGTDVIPALDALAKAGVDVAVIFTDGYVPGWPTVKPKFHVVVITTAQPGPDWATNIRVNK